MGNIFTKRKMIGPGGLAYVFLSTAGGGEGIADALEMHTGNLRSNAEAGAEEDVQDLKAKLATLAQVMEEEFLGIQLVRRVGTRSVPERLEAVRHMMLLKKIEPGTAKNLPGGDKALTAEAWSRFEDYWKEAENLQNRISVSTA